MRRASISPGSSQVVNVYICPSSTRSPDGGRDGVDPNDGGISAVTDGYGYNDYGPTCYTDIDPFGQHGGDRRDRGDSVP